MNTKLFLIAILSGLITAGGLVGYRFLSENIKPATIRISGMVLIIAFFHVMALFVSRRMEISLNYGSSFLTVVISSAIMVPLFLYIVFMYEPIDIHILTAGIIFFFVVVAIGAIVSIFFRQTKSSAVSSSGQLDDPNF